MRSNTGLSEADSTAACLKSTRADAVLVVHCPSKYGSIANGPYDQDENVENPLGRWTAGITLDLLVLGVNG